MKTTINGKVHQKMFDNTYAKLLAKQPELKKKFEKTKEIVSLSRLKIDLENDFKYGRELQD